MIGSPIKFYEKNIFDLSFDGVEIFVWDSVAEAPGELFLHQLRDRKNYTGWGTSGSNDSANTELQFLNAEALPITDFFLIGHNFGDYKIQRVDDAQTGWIDFDPPIEVSGNTKRTTHHTLPEAVLTVGIQIVINGTIVPNSDKLMAQFVATQKIGEFERYPKIQRPTISRRRRRLSSLTGKSKVMQSLGSFSVNLVQDEEFSQNDIMLIDRLYNRFGGFLVWLGGGNEMQFRNLRESVRPEDLYFMTVANENVPEMIDGFYYRGSPINFQLVESL